MSPARLDPAIARRLRDGLVIPAHPLALTAARRLDERRQRALTRYYLAAGAGGIAVGVHTTQFGIRAAGVDLLRPVLELAAATIAATEAVTEAATETGTATGTGTDTVRIAGICGPTAQAVAEAALAGDCGYHLGLLSLAALPDATDAELLAHARAVGEVIPVFGFYLQPAVGGRVLDYPFWRRFAALECVAAIKIAPFDRYRTLDVLRGVADSGRAADIALYTGNDDAIVHDLLARYPFGDGTLRLTGGLLGHWSVWTERAVALFHRIRAHPRDPELPRIATAVTDCNGAFFDVAHGFRGCIAGLHEVLRRQGLLAGTWCLDPEAGLSPGQGEAIDRVYAAYPELNDDAFVAAHRDAWLR